MAKIDKEKLIELRRDGKTTGECAKELGCSVEAVRYRLKKLEADEFQEPADSIDASDYIAEKQLQSADDEICYEPVNPVPETERKTAAEWLAAEEEAERNAAEKEAELAKLKIRAIPSDPPVGMYADVVYDPRRGLYPVPPIDRKTFWECRRDDLRRAICDYACEGLRVDPKWVEEYNELIERCKE